jgi:preprotein translocase subunit SecA
MVQNLGLDDIQQVRIKSVSKSIESAQKKVEGNNYDMRKSLLDYDNIVSEQRKIIYERRNEVLDSEDIHPIVLDMFKDHIEALVDSHIEPEGYLTEADKESIINEVNHTLLRTSKISPDDLKDKNDDETYEFICDRVIEEYEKKTEIVPEEMRRDFEKHISLRVIDEAWVKHISDMDALRDGIGLRGYGQRSPLQAYAMEGYDMFEEMLRSIDESVSNFLLRMEIKQNFQARQMKGQAGDGKQRAKSEPIKVEKKVGRNDACPCGSGKKYKNCCGK